MAMLSQLINAKAIAIAKLAVRATTAAGSGHPSSALALAHLTATLMYHTMRWRPEQPRDPGAVALCCLRTMPCQSSTQPAPTSVLPSFPRAKLNA